MTEIDRLRRDVRNAEFAVEHAQEDLDAALGALRDAEALEKALADGGWAVKLCRELSWRGVDVNPEAPPEVLVDAAKALVGAPVPVDAAVLSTVRDLAEQFQGAA